MITVLLCLLCLPILPLAAVVTDTKPQCVKLLTNCVGTLRQFKHREMSDLDNILQLPYKHPQAVAGDLDNDNDIDLCIGIWHEGAEIPGRARQLRLSKSCAWLAQRRT